MPVKRTSKYQLSQWERTDQVLMEDFNTDNLNVENALAGLEASKAKQTDLEALTNTVNTKANQTDLASLRTEVAAKAAQAELNSVSTSLNTAKASIPRIKIGTYTGDGQQNRTIPLDFTPEAVLVMNNHGCVMYEEQLYDQNWGGLAVKNSPVTSVKGGLTVVEIVTNGFTVHYQLVNNSTNAYTNSANVIYHYIAFG